MAQLLLGTMALPKYLAALLYCGTMILSGAPSRAADAASSPGHRSAEMLPNLPDSKGTRWTVFPKNKTDPHVWLMHSLMATVDGTGVTGTRADPPLTTASPGAGTRTAGGVWVYPDLTPPICCSSPKPPGQGTSPQC